MHAVSTMLISARLGAGQDVIHSARSEWLQIKSHEVKSTGLKQCIGSPAEVDFVEPLVLVRRHLNPRDLGMVTYSEAPQSELAQRRFGFLDL